MQRRMIGLLAVLTLLCAFSAAMAEPFNFAPKVTEAPAQTPLVQATPTPVVDGIPYSLGISAFPAERGESRKVLLSFLGDCTLGCNEIDHGKKKSLDYYIGEFGFGYCFEKVRYILDRDDLTVGNLECVLADTPDGLDARTKKTYNFRAYESYVNILKEGSVEAVTVANNHIGDYGQPGFDATVRVLCENGVSWFGSTDWGGQFYIYEQDGVRIGLVGSHVSFYWQNVDQMKAVFDHLREENCQVIIAVIHAGVEYDKRHDDNQTKMAKRFIEWGADIVIGHHPHVLQGFEVIDGVPIYYSLGNFVFAGNFLIKTKYTAIMQLALSFAEDGSYLGSRANFIPCRLSEHHETNFFQPFPVTGVDAERAIKQMQYDTKAPWLLRDYLEGIGAMQDFIPAVDRGL
ncbi:MAG: CapA family protein [Clostridia bacterium]|nr:CapA family protein [Clostridia bacterium]